jgi:predicted enzyme related to lactoylglutathione lyase
MRKQELSSFVWHELHTTDAAAASRFYTEVFDWTTDDVSSLGRPYLTLRAGSEAVAGILPKSISSFEADSTQPRWMGYIQVPDAEVYIARVTRAGGRVRRSIQEIAGLGRFAVAADPGDAVFVLYQPLFQVADVSLQDVRRSPFSWHNLLCTDCSSQSAFYSSVFV